MQLEATLQRRLDDDRRAARNRHHVGIADPIGRGDDDFVANVAGGQKRVEQDLLAPRPHNRLRGLVVETVLPLELGGDGLAQRHDAQNGGIFGLAALDGGDGGFLDVVGRIKIRLADGQRDDVAACVLEIARLLRGHHGGGGLHAGDGAGEERHLELRFNRLKRDAPHSLLEPGWRRQNSELARPRQQAKAPLGGRGRFGRRVRRSERRRKAEYIVQPAFRLVAPL